jgi:PKD repeat protein
MKKVSLLSIVIFFLLSSCQKYEFEGEDLKVLDTEIQFKNSQGNFMAGDTATITANIQVILKAVTINGNPDQWYWDFGDGSNGQGQQVDHLYTDIGTYTVTVTAIDGNNSDESTIVLIVGSLQEAVFSLYSAGPPNNQGQIRYIVLKMTF